MTVADWDENCKRLHGSGGALEGRRALRPTLEKWARQYGLERQDWVIGAALEILRYNGDHEPEPSDVAYAVRFPLTAVRETPRFVFDTSSWHPEAERWSSFAFRAREDFEQALEDYRVAVARPYSSERTTRARWTDEHFEWFVLCQILDKPPTVVLEEYGRGRGEVTTITKALASVADLVQWVGPVKHLPRRSRK